MTELFGDYLDPNWESGGAVHNWRNHVGDQIKAIWSTFTPEQRAALAQDAQERAANEEWD